MTPAQIAIAASEGYSIICATCRHLHKARSEGGTNCGKTSCGGPLSGRDFPRYSGPITDFTRWCMVCGEKSKYGAVVAGSDRVFGLCTEHSRVMERWRPVNLEGDAKVIEEVKTPDGELIHPNRLFGSAPRSLFKAIAEVEKEFGESDGS